MRFASSRSQFLPNGILLIVFPFHPIRQRSTESKSFGSNRATNVCPIFPFTFFKRLSRLRSVASDEHCNAGNCGVMKTPSPLQFCWIFGDLKLLNFTIHLFLSCCQLVVPKTPLPAFVRLSDLLPSAAKYGQLCHSCHPLFIKRNYRCPAKMYHVIRKSCILLTGIVRQSRI